MRGRFAIFLTPFANGEFSQRGTEVSTAGHRREKSPQLAFVERAVRSNARAEVEPEGCDFLDGAANILWSEAAREKYGDADRLANLSAQRPVMRLACAA